MTQPVIFSPDRGVRELTGTLKEVARRMERAEGRLSQVEVSGRASSEGASNNQPPPILNTTPGAWQNAVSTYLQPPLWATTILVQAVATAHVYGDATNGVTGLWGRLALDGSDAVPEGRLTQGPAGFWDVNLAAAAVFMIDAGSLNIVHATLFLCGGKTVYSANGYADVTLTATYLS